jgi:uncharacterized Tic20 family protein
MKQSTKLGVMLVLTTIWLLATMFAVAEQLIIMKDMISVYMILCPFIAFVVLLIMYSLKYREENKPKDLW